MKRIAIALLLSFIGPGLGQLYNRDIKKGAWLLVASALLFVVPLFWLMLNVAPLLPDPKTQVVTQEMVQAAVLQVIKNDTHTLNLISFAFLGLWAYAITQAYFKAREINEREKTNNSQTDDE